MTTSVATPAADAPADKPVLLTVKQVATLLSVSQRHVFRLADGGKLPAPRRLGNAVRWSRIEIESWIAAGCPSGRNGIGN